MEWNFIKYTVSLGETLQEDEPTEGPSEDLQDGLQEVGGFPEGKSGPVCISSCFQSCFQSCLQSCFQLGSLLDARWPRCWTLVTANQSSAESAAWISKPSPPTFQLHCYHCSTRLIRAIWRMEVCSTEAVACSLFMREFQLLTKANDLVLHGKVSQVALGSCR